MEKPKYLKISLYPFQSNSRDARELETAEKAGFTDIALLTFTGEKGQAMVENSHWNHTFIPRRPLGDAPLARQLGKLLTSFLFVFKARSFHAKVLSGHDLLGLLIAYLATIGRRKETLLIYDAHEYELGRSTGKPRTPMKKKWIGRLEKFLIQKSALTICVNSSIARQMEEDYGMSFAHVVVRNIPVARPIDRDLLEKNRRLFREKLGLGPKDPLLVYHGNLTQGRGIEPSIRLLAENKNAGLLILGNGPQSYRDQLRGEAEKLGVQERILFHPAVPGEVLLSYVGACDIAMILIRQKPKSYYFALPNKLFESIHASLPIICSDSPELSALVDGYGLGVCVSPEDGKAIKKAMDLLWEPDYYNKAKSRMKKAQEDLTWEKEEEKLFQVMKDLRDFLERGSREETGRGF